MDRRATVNGLRINTSVENRVSVLMNALTEGLCQYLFVPHFADEAGSPGTSPVRPVLLPECF